MRSRHALAASAVVLMLTGAAPGVAETGDTGTLFGPQIFGAATLCGNSPTAEGIAPGDFTGDAIPDLVLTDFCASGLVLLAGRGDGTFDAPTRIPTGLAPDAVTAAELDGDGNLDLIVSNAINDVLVLYGDGSGGFADQSRYFVPGLAPGAVVAADFDRDGALDFAVAATPSVVFSATDTRTFTGRAVAAGVAATGIGAADFDSDGIIDLAVLSGVPLLTIGFGLGDGTFGRIAHFAAPALVQEAMRVADITGDNRPDVVTVNSLGGINVWLGTGRGVSFPPNWSYGTLGNAGLALGDVTGDGVVDLITADSVVAHVTIYRGDGAGHFERVEYHWAPISVESLALVDLNRDGRLDIVAAPMAGPGLSVYLHK
ncbi:FG-GAP repeat domain-containing protein [Nocardia brasiliensis]